MKAGKITAKLRDAVKVCFMVEGEEVKRYKNIEMPDALKDLEIRDFHFNILTDSKIEFWLHFDQGVLPEEWPECRERRARSPKTASVVLAAAEAPETPETPETSAPIAEPSMMVGGDMPSTEPTEAQEVIEADAEPAPAPDVETMPAPENQRALKGRKPGSRFHKVQVGVEAL